MLRVFILLGFMVLSACAYSPTGALVSVPTMPVSTGSVVSAGSATQATKEGEASCWNILGIAAFGDCSIEKAKKNGGITEVITVDQENLGIIGLVYRAKTVVKGN